MPVNANLSLIALAAVLAAAPAQAQEAPADPAPVAADEDAQDSGTEILVVAERVRGQVDAPQPPIATFDEKEVAALGASSLLEVGHGSMIAGLAKRTIPDVPVRNVATPGDLESFAEVL